MKPRGLLRPQAIRFQLASLMDLLLIIVFAQFLDFRSTEVDARVETQRTIAEAETRVAAKLQERTDQLNQTREQLIRDNQQLRLRTEQASLIAAEAQQRQALTEELLKKWLQIDPNLVDQDASPAESADAVERAETTAKTIVNADGSTVLRFLVGYDELLKRAEVWTVHVSDRGDIELQAGRDTEQAFSFRLESRSQLERTDEFVRQFRAAYSQVPQPKGLVIVLVSYSPRAVAGNYQPMLDGMPDVIEWLAKDSGGRSRFEYAVIGAMTDPKRDLPQATTTSP